MGVRIRTTIRQVGKQVPFVVVETKLALLLLHSVHLKINSQVCGYAYSNINSQTHLVEFGADAAIYSIGQCLTIEHSHVVLVLKPLNLKACYAFRHRLVPYVHRVIHP